MMLLKGSSAVSSLAMGSKVIGSNQPLYIKVGVKLLSIFFCPPPHQMGTQLGLAPSDAFDFGI